MDGERVARFFKDMERQYLVRLIIEVLLLVGNIFTQYRLVTAGSKLAWANVLLLLVIIVMFIADMARYKDAGKVVRREFQVRQKRVRYNKIKGNELNGIYCKLYIDDVDKNIIKGLKSGVEYDIVYLEDTMGKYIVEVKETKHK